MHVVLTTQRPCQHPAEPCSCACRYRLHGRATCALVAAEHAHGPGEIAALSGMPARLVAMALASGMRRWRFGMRQAGFRAPRAKPGTLADERADVVAQVQAMMARLVTPHGPCRRLTSEEIRGAYPGIKISAKGRNNG